MATVGQGQTGDETVSVVSQLFLLKTKEVLVPTESSLMVKRPSLNCNNVPKGLATVPFVFP